MDHNPARAQSSLRCAHRSSPGAHHRKARRSHREPVLPSSRLRTPCRPASTRKPRNPTTGPPESAAPRRRKHSAATRPAAASRAKERATSRRPVAALLAAVSQDEQQAELGCPSSNAARTRRAAICGWCLPSGQRARNRRRLAPWSDRSRVRVSRLARFVREAGDHVPGRAAPCRSRRPERGTAATASALMEKPSLAQPLATHLFDRSLCPRVSTTSRRVDGLWSERGRARVPGMVATVVIDRECRATPGQDGVGRRLVARRRATDRFCQPFRRVVLEFPVVAPLGEKRRAVPARFGAWPSRRVSRSPAGGDS